MSHGAHFALLMANQLALPAHPEGGNVASNRLYFGIDGVGGGGD